MKQRIVLDAKTGRILTTLSKYSPDLLPLVEDYIKNNEYPLLERLAPVLGVHYTALQDWRDKHKEFRDLYKRLLDKQKAFLMEKGLYNEVNPIMAIFQLKANHGMRDTPENNQDTTINVQNISYKDASKEAKKEIKKIGILGKSIKEAKQKKTKVKEMSNDGDDSDKNENKTDKGYSD